MSPVPVELGHGPHPQACTPRPALFTDNVVMMHFAVVAVLPLLFAPRATEKVNWYDVTGKNGAGVAREPRRFGAKG